ncbi:MAG: 5-(carboxyamino)imidazole ribonucleotide synthase [Terrimicrobiaceae bacterium]
MKRDVTPILPGSTLGILGGGQLGRMFAIAARRMGYRVHTLEPAPDSPAGQVCDLEVVAPYDDLDAVRRFARGVDVISFEFENIPRASVQAASEICPVRPSADVLHVCQNREREKVFLRSKGFPCAPFHVVESLAGLSAGLTSVGTPAVLKTADFGYDGKGQIKLQGGEDPAEIWKAFGEARAVLEGWIPFEAELSVIVARGLDGSVVAYPPVENRHRNHVLDVTIAPAGFAPEILSFAVKLAEEIATALEVVGLLAVEMFLCAEGRLLVNELAPRPHNSGHFTFDACVTSQFEQQLRAVCGLPLGSTDLLAPAVMLNLLGDRWQPRTPDWCRLLSDPSAKLHLYGKHEARPGRKMGHVTFLGRTEPPALDGL